jgi:serine/threonine protein kinase
MEAIILNVYNDQNQMKENHQVKTIRNYLLLELIGKGAFGSVYLCKKGENKYALKIIPLEMLRERGR